MSALRGDPDRGGRAACEATWIASSAAGAEQPGKLPGILAHQKEPRSRKAEKPVRIKTILELFNVRVP